MKESAHTKKARAMLCRGGYKAGGHVKAHDDEAEDKALIKKEVSKAKIRLRDGGMASGDEPKHRSDRKGRGHHKGKGKGAHVTVNVVNAHPNAAPMPKPVPVPVPVPPGGPGGMPPPGPMAGPPGGMPPDQGPPPGLKRGGRAKKMSSGGRDSIKGMPDGHFKKGGRTGAKFPVPMEAGAGGGLGRLEKAKMQARK